MRTFVYTHAHFRMDAKPLSHGRKGTFVYTTGLFRIYDKVAAGKCAYSRQKALINTTKKLFSRRFFRYFEKKQ